jgi:hypothetical protein
MGKMPGVGRMVRRGPYEVIEAMHMPTGNFVLRIGSPGVDHTLDSWKTGTQSFRHRPHTAVQFSAHPISRFHLMLRTVFKKPSPWDMAQHNTGSGQ